MKGVVSEGGGGEVEGEGGGDLCGDRGCVVEEFGDFWGIGDVEEIDRSGRVGYGGG